MCSAESAGVRAATNQSETNAAATLETSSDATTSPTGHSTTVPTAPFGSLPCRLVPEPRDASSSGEGRDSRRTEPGIERTNTISNTTAATLESAPS